MASKRSEERSDRMETAHKVCRSCGTRKPLSEFHRTGIKNGRLYHRGECKACCQPKDRARYHGEAVPACAPSSIPDPEHSYAQQDFVEALLALGRFSPDRIGAYTAEKFERKTNSAQAMRRAGVSFDEVREGALAELERRGMCEPEEEILGAGRYLIVGDSHGKHTSKEVFALLQVLVRELEPDRIIHIGHMLDDDGDISYLWEDFSDLLVVAKPEELADLHKLGLPIVREQVRLGRKICVCNQELISDYVRTPLTGLDQGIFPGNLIVNLHRMERGPRCAPVEAASFIASPGCLCSPHIIKTVKQIDFTEGYTVKQAYPDGFYKYRRAKQLMRHWTSGIVVVDVDEEGRGHMAQLRIQEVGGNAVAVAFAGRIYSSSGIRKPSFRAIVVADSHAPQIHGRVLDLQEQVAGMLGKVDALLDLGDSVNFQSLCHHELDRGRVAKTSPHSVLGETAAAHWVLARRRSWATDAYLLFANHERFAEDFVMRNPQFRHLLDLELLLGTGQLGYTTSGNKSVLDVGPFRAIHGDMKLFGQTGTNLDKISQAFSKDNKLILTGHFHYNGIRKNVHSVAMSGLYDQGYNETAATVWGQGMAVAVVYAGVPFVQLVDFHPDGTCGWDGLVLRGRDIEIPREAMARIDYSF